MILLNQKKKLRYPFWRLKKKLKKGRFND